MSSFSTMYGFSFLIWKGVFYSYLILQKVPTTPWSLLQNIFYALYFWLFPSEHWFWQHLRPVAFHNWRICISVLSYVYDWCSKINRVCCSHITWRFWLMFSFFYKNLQRIPLPKLYKKGFGTQLVLLLWWQLLCPEWYSSKYVLITVWSMNWLPLILTRQE